MPVSIEEKREFLLRNHIAVWDVIESCEIEGSADSSIKNVKANNIGKVLKNTRISLIFVNGKTAEKLYNKYVFPVLGKECVCLPSTSPANAAWSLEKLIGAWKIIRSDNK